MHAFRVPSPHLCALPWRTRSPNAGSAPFDANSLTAPSSGTAANSTSLSSTTSITTTRTGPTVHSTSYHPSPPTHQTSQIDTSKSLERPAVADSSTSTEMPPDQPRHSCQHPQGCSPTLGSCVRDTAEAGRPTPRSCGFALLNWSPVPYLLERLLRWMLRCQPPSSQRSSLQRQLGPNRPVGAFDCGV